MTITFTPLQSIKKQGAIITGFAEKPMLEMGGPFITVASKRDHWWQTDEMIEALKIIKGCLNDFKPMTVTTYGASMGAYGALLFADRLGADKAVAIAPQFSIDREKVKFEKRWNNEARRIQFIDDDMTLRLRGKCRKFILYDPYSLDKPHVALMQGYNAECIPVPFASHAVGRFLLETGQLRSVLTKVCNGKANGWALRKIVVRAVKRRRRSEAYATGIVQYFSQRLPDNHVIHDTLASHFLQEYPENFKIALSLGPSYFLRNHENESIRYAEYARSINESLPQGTKVFNISGNHFLL